MFIDLNMFSVLSEDWIIGDLVGIDVVRKKGSGDCK